MKRVNLLLLLMLGVVAMGHAEPLKQKEVARVEKMPNMPMPFAMRDWQKVARQYDAYVFDFTKKGEHLPLIWWDDTKVNYDRRGFGLYSYVGHIHQMKTRSHEAINCMGAVMAASLAGIDKSDQDGHNWVLMCQDYFNRANGQDLYLNGIGAKTGGSFWYELYPNVIAFHLMWKYPGLGDFDTQMRRIADRLHDACVVLAGDKDLKRVPNFNWTAFDYKKMERVDNGRWREPDAAAAVAWMEYLAWTQLGDEKYLKAALASLAFLEQRKSNPLYEILMPYGVYIAARANAEQGWNVDVDKLLNWCFGPSEARPGWGIIADRWGNYDCHGLAGSLTDGGGYAFAMNTYVNAGALTPVARYDARYARAIGKWMLNAANACRLFYPNAWPPQQQTCWDWAETYGATEILTYEGLRKNWKGTSPRAMGDPLVHGWAKTDLALYGASYVGIMAAIIRPTNHEHILQLNCRATDPFSRGYPTYLYFNPYNDDKSVAIDVGTAPSDLYDAVSRRFLQRNVNGKTSFEIAGDEAVVLVVCPAGKKALATKQGLTVAGEVIDYSIREARGSAALNSRLEEPDLPDRSRVYHAPQATITVDGDDSDWRDLADTPLLMDTSGRGDMRCRLRWAWDKDYFYMLAQELPGDATQDEAARQEDYVSGPWNYDGISLFFDLDNSSDGEQIGEVNVWLGFSSSGRKTLHAARAQKSMELSGSLMPGMRMTTAGSQKKGDRRIEVAWAWKDWARVVDAQRQPGGNLARSAKSGLRFGCEPLLVDDNWRHQAFIGGERRPSGRDANSLDIVLSGLKRGKDNR